MALGDPADPAISEAALRRLRRAIERLVNAAGLRFQGYISEDYIESGLADAMLMDFRATGLPVVSGAFTASGDEWSEEYDVLATLDGEGTTLVRRRADRCRVERRRGRAAASASPRRRVGPC